MIALPATCAYTTKYGWTYVWIVGQSLEYGELIEVVWTVDL